MSINTQNFQSLIVNKLEPVSSISDSQLNINFFNGISYTSKTSTIPTQYDIVFCCDGHNYNTTNYIQDVDNILNMLKGLQNVDIQIASPNVGWINPSTSNRIYRELQIDDAILSNEYLGYFPNYSYDPNNSLNHPFFTINEDRFYNQEYWNNSDYIITPIEYFLPKLPFNRSIIGIKKTILDELYHTESGNWPLNDTERMNWLTTHYVYYPEKLFYTNPIHDSHTYSESFTDLQAFQDWMTRNNWFFYPDYYNMCDTYDLKQIHPFNCISHTISFFNKAKRSGSQLIYIMLGKNYEAYKNSSWFEELHSIKEHNIWVFYFTESFKHDILSHNSYSGLLDSEITTNTTEKDIFSKRLANAGSGYFLDGYENFNTMISNVSEFLSNPLKHQSVNCVHDNKFLSYNANYTINGSEVTETNPFVEIKDFTQPIITDVLITEDGTDFVLTHIMKNPSDLTGDDKSNDFEFFKNIKIEVFYYKNTNLVHSDILYVSDKVLRLPKQSYSEDLVVTRSYAIDKYGNVQVAPKMSIIGNFTFPNKLAMGAPSYLLTKPIEYTGEISFKDVSLETPYFDDDYLKFNLFTESNNPLPSDLIAKITLISDDLRIVINDEQIVPATGIQIAKNFLHAGSYYYVITLFDSLNTKLKIFDGFCQNFQDLENASFSLVYNNWNFTGTQIQNGVLLTIPNNTISNSRVEVYRFNTKVADINSGRQITYTDNATVADISNGQITYTCKLYTKFDVFTYTRSIPINLVGGVWTPLNFYSDPLSFPTDDISYYNGYNYEYQIGQINLYDKRFFNVEIGEYTKNASDRFQNAETSGGSMEEADEEFVENFIAMTTETPSGYIYDFDTVKRFIESVSSENKRFATDYIFTNSVYQSKLVNIRKYTNTCILYPFKYHKTYRNFLPVFAFNVENSETINYEIDGQSFELNIPKIGEIHNTHNTFMNYIIDNIKNLYYGHDETGITLEFSQNMIFNDSASIVNSSLSYKSGFFFNSKFTKYDKNGKLSFIFNNYIINIDFSALAYSVEHNGRELFKEYIFEYGEETNSFFDIEFDNDELIANSYLIQLTVYHNEIYIYLYNYNTKKDAYVYQFFTEEVITPLTKFGIKMENSGGKFINPTILNLDEYYCGDIYVNSMIPSCGFLDTTRVNQIIKVSSEKSPIVYCDNYVSQFDQSTKTFTTIENYMMLQIGHYDFADCLVQKSSGRISSERFFNGNNSITHLLYSKDYSNILRLSPPINLLQNLNILNQTCIAFKTYCSTQAFINITTQTNLWNIQYEKTGWNENILCCLNNNIYFFVNGMLNQIIANDISLIKDLTITFDRNIEAKDIYLFDLSIRPIMLQLESFNSAQINVSLLTKETFDIHSIPGSYLNNYWNEIIKNAEIDCHYIYDFSTQLHEFNFYFKPYKNIFINFLKSFGTELDVQINIIKKDIELMSTDLDYTYAIEDEYISVKLNNYEITRVSESFIIKIILNYNSESRTEIFDFALTQYFMKEREIEIYRQIQDGINKIYLVRHKYGTDEILQNVQERGNNLNITSQ